MLSVAKTAVRGKGRQRQGSPKAANFGAWLGLVFRGAVEGASEPWAGMWFSVMNIERVEGACAAPFQGAARLWRRIARSIGVFCYDYEGGRQASEQPPAVYRLEPETGDIRIVANDFDGPNGLAFSPDETRLYIAETGNQTEPSPRQYIRVFNIGPDGATLSGGDIFHKIEPGYCDGMRVDEHGNIWSSAADGVHCISAGGELLGRIFVPHRVSNVTFGGPAKNRLFIGGSTTLYAIFLNCRGVQVP